MPEMLDQQRKKAAMNILLQGFLGKLIAERFKCKMPWCK
jgi:hypothetical protein